MFSCNRLSCVGAARDLAAAALFAAGKKVTLVQVKDGSCSVLAEASPGNTAALAEHMDLDAAADALPARPLLDDGTVIAVKVSGRAAGSNITGNVGVVAWDPAKKDLSMVELHDDDGFTSLEGILVAVNAMEVLMCEGDLGDHEGAKMAAMLENCGVACTVMEKKKFSDVHVAADLERLVGSHLPLVRFLDMKLVMPAAAALVNFLGLTSDESNEGCVTASNLDHASFMHLDTAALRALNVVSFTGDGGGGKKATLYGLLNQTKSAMGSRLLRRWLAQPLQDIVAINSRLDATGAFIEAVTTRGSVRDDHLHRMPDLNLLIGRFTKNNAQKATLQDVVRLYQSSIRLPYFIEALEDSKSDVLVKRFLEPLSKHVKDLANFEALVETTIDLDQIDNGEFVINPKIQPQLAELRESQNALVARIADEHSAVLAKVRPPKDDALKLEKRDNAGYVFRVTRKDEKLIRGKSAYIIVDTRKDGVRFVTRELKKLSAEYSEVAKEYSGMEEDLRSKTISVAATYMESFASLAEIVAEMDVLSSFATVATSARDDYSRPKMIGSGAGCLVLKQSRHPMVEECLDGRDFIANDLEMRHDEGRGSLLLVTGPNTGGKSTFIRTAGVLTLMSHIGCFVPAQEAIVPITDRILCRVGAGDNQHRAVSTFMSEMLETAAILRVATPRSLVIIDELGRGTGVSDGYGLAYAISHYLATELKAPTLFATHFHELTTSLPCAKNLHATAITDEKEGLTFLYSIKEGACGKSYGVHVAELARFPPQVVAAAKRKLSELDNVEGSDRRLSKLVKC